MAQPAHDLPRVLIADDQPDVLAAARLLLKSEGCDVTTASSPAEVLELLDSNEYDVLLLDLNYSRDTTSGQEGLELVPRVLALDSTLPIIVMTARALFAPMSRRPAPTPA